MARPPPDERPESPPAGGRTSPRDMAGGTRRAARATRSGKGSAIKTTKRSMGPLDFRGALTILQTLTMWAEMRRAASELNA